MTEIRDALENKNKTKERAEPSLYRRHHSDEVDENSCEEFWLLKKFAKRHNAFLRGECRVVFARHKFACDSNQSSNFELKIHQSYWKCPFCRSQLRTLYNNFRSIKFAISIYLFTVINLYLYLQGVHWCGHIYVAIILIQLIFESSFINI